VQSIDGKSTLKRLKGVGLQDIWREFEKAYDAGLTKAIGVSNYPAITLNDCLNYARIPPTVNQVERHPYFAQPKLVKVCHDFNVHVTAYGSLGAPGLDRGQPLNLMEDQVIMKIAAKHNKTPGQVLLRWSVENNVIVIPKSVNPERIKENSQIFDFKLTEEEVKEIDALDKNHRTFTQEWFGWPTFA